MPQWQSGVVAMETASSENPKIFTTWPSTEKKITIPLSRLKREYEEFEENVLELKEIQHLEKYQRKRLWFSGSWSVSNQEMTLVH